MPERFLTPRERIAARYLTGPVAHFFAGVADWVVLLLRYARGRLRGDAQG